MDENINVVNENEDIATNDEANDTQDNELKEKLSDAVEKLRTQAMLLGARAMTVTIANMIDGDMNKPGKRTMADMRRLVKKVRDFCQKAIDHPVEQPKFGDEEENNDE